MYVFVLGTGRCGSTLVHEVLARHPDVGFVSNLEDNIGALRFTGRANSTLYRRMPSALTQKGRVRYAPSEAYAALSREVSPMLAMPSRDLTASDVTPWLDARFKEFFERRAREQGLPVFSHKFTGWPRVGFVNEILPGTRFVHIVRDGRAVANSWLQMPWWLGHLGPSRWHFGPLPTPYEKEWESSNRDFVLLAGLAWKLLMDSYEASEAATGAPSWLTLRYEDFIDNPRESFATLLDFCELEWTDGFEQGFRLHTFTATRRDAYRNDLSQAQVEMLDRSLSTHLEKAGYQV